MPLWLRYLQFLAHLMQFPRVGVDAGGDADVGVAEEFLDDDEVDALFQEQGGGRVAEVVEADRPELGLVEEAAEAAGEVGGVEWLALRSGEDEPVVRPARSGRLALFLLSFLVDLEGGDALGGEGDAAFGGEGLGVQDGQALGAGALEGAVDGGGSPIEVEVFPVEAEEFALTESGAQGEFVQGVQTIIGGRLEELPGFGGGEGLEAPGAGRGGLDVAGDVARQLVLADGVFQGGLEDRVDVRHGQRRQSLAAALADGAAGLPNSVSFLGTALAGGAESVEEGADVASGEPGEPLGAEAGVEVEADGGGVAGVGVLPQVVDGDAVQPVREVGAHGAVRRCDGQAAVAGGDLLGELGEGFLAGGAVDADALAGVAGGEDVSGGFPAAVLALVDSSVAVGADAAGGGRARCGHQAASCSRRVRMKSVTAWVGMRRARPRVIEASWPVRSRS